MAKAEMSYKGWGWLKVPVGVWIYLRYDEANALSHPLTQEAVSNAVGAIGPWGAIAARVVVAQQEYIRKRNAASGGKGVRCFFVPWTGMIMSVERLGFGAAPETPVSVSPGATEEREDRKPGPGQQRL